MNKFTWQDLELNVEQIYTQIKKTDFSPEEIIGIKKGGMFPALIMSYYFKNAHLRGITAHHYGPTIFPVEITSIDLNYLNNKSVLVVDDVIETGETMLAVINEIKKFSPKIIKTACLIQKVNSKKYADYYGIITINELSMPWYRIYKKIQTNTIQKGSIS